MAERHVSPEGYVCPIHGDSCYVEVECKWPNIPYGHYHSWACGHTLNPCCDACPNNPQDRGKYSPIWDMTDG